jgi:hypothetical protein
MPCAVGWAGDVPGLDFGEAALQGDHEFTKSSISREVACRTLEGHSNPVYGVAFSPHSLKKIVIIGVPCRLFRGTL